MTLRRQLSLWIVAALASVLLLICVLRYSGGYAQRRFAASVAPRPAAGRLVFESKGCAACHGAEATGTPSGPALRQRASLSSIPKLVIAMWNHAPRMWTAMREQKLPYRSLNYEETSQLIAYLYISGSDDKAGDIQNGATLFTGAKHCVRCHAANGRESNLASAAATGTALDWTQALWNHATVMRARMRASGLEWPRFGANDIRDLLAYICHQNGVDRQQNSATAGDPDNGWAVFQQKGCIRCHSLTSDTGGVGPYLGPGQTLPPTFSQFGAALLNHIPQMENAIAGQGFSWPEFERNDVRDLTVFLYTLRYLEPAGSTQIGRTVFSWRGCARCHGVEAEGDSAPRLRGRGTVYTASRLATDLWRHGSRMYERLQRDGQPWPELQETDVGNLLAFLNSAPGQ
jgi:mono/diheme cytochrome c family protein